MAARRLGVLDRQTPFTDRERSLISAVRLWSLHPKYLDAKGLVAVWREGLLARAVLRGRTVGYRLHPQLIRFKGHAKPLAAISAYLHVVCDEAKTRGYRFNRTKLGRRIGVTGMRVTTGQLAFELRHLLRKLRNRDRKRYERLRRLRLPECHPLFKRVRGKIEKWEKV